MQQQQPSYMYMKNGEQLCKRSLWRALGCGHGYVNACNSLLTVRRQEYVVMMMSNTANAHTCS